VLTGGSVSAQRGYDVIANISVDPNSAQRRGVVECQLFENGDDFGRAQVGI